MNWKPPHSSRVYHVRAHQARRLIVSSWQRDVRRSRCGRRAYVSVSSAASRDAPPEPADVAEAPVMNSFALCTAPVNLSRRTCDIGSVRPDARRGSMRPADRRAAL